MAGPVSANAPDLTITIEVPNGSGLVFVIRAYSGVNATGTLLYEGASEPQSLTGAPISVAIKMNLSIGVTASATTVEPGASVDLSGTVSGQPAPASSPLLWTATGGTLGSAGVNGADISWLAPTTPGSYVITANIDPAVNPTHDPSVTGSVVITVADLSAPVITLNGPAMVTVAQGAAYADAGATAVDNIDGDLSAQIAVASNVNTSVVGDYAVTYTVKDAAGNAATPVVRTVKVRDQTAPVVTLVGASPLVVAHGSLFVDPGASVSDNVDAALSTTVTGSVDTGTLGSYTLSYDATDAAGNAAATVTRTVNVTDQTAPVITLLGANPLTVAHGALFVDPGSAVMDNIDAGLVPTVSGSVDVNLVGSYVLTYSVADAAGNLAASVSRTVNVTDQTAPVITLVGADPLVVAQGAVFSDPGAMVSDNVDTGLTATVTGTVDSATVGSYTLSYTISDAAGNAAATVTRTVQVTDQTAPVVTAPASITIAAVDATGTPAATSASGIDPAQYLSSVVRGGTTFVAVGGTTLTSSDGINWTTQASGTPYGLNGVAWNGAQFVAVGGSGSIVTSADGTTWTASSSGTTENLMSVVWNGTQYVVVGGNGFGLASPILTSPDGISWTQQNSGTTNVLRGVAWSGVQFVAVGYGGTILSSPDGVTWTLQTSGTTNRLHGVAWGGTQFVAVGNPGTILTSPDGIVWTAQASGTGSRLNGVAWSGTQFVAVGDSNATILTSSDGINWTQQVPGTTSWLFGVTWSGSQFVVVGGYQGTILTSPDGIAWGVPASALAAFLNGATATDNVDTAPTVTNDAPAQFPLGTTTVIFSSTDAAGNTSTATSTVTVTDQTAPEITILGANPVTLAQGSAYTDAGATVLDNVDGDISASIVTVNNVNTAVTGTYTVIYDVSDAAGNAAATVTRTVNVADQVAPIITLNGNSPMTVAQGSIFTDPGATASDNTDGDISANIAVTGTVDAATVGSYTLSYNVVDAAGNAATTLTRTVHVTDQTGPVIQVAGTNLIINGGFDSNAAGWTASNIDPSGGYVASGGSPGGAYILNDAGASYSDPTISQTVSGLVPGTSYRIGGLYKEIYTGAGNPVALSFGVLVDGSAILQQARPSGWTAFSVSFVATQSSHVIAFAGERNGDDSSYLVDNLYLSVAGAMDTFIVPAVDANGTPASDASIQTILAGVSASDNVDGAVAVTHNAPAQFPLGGTTVTFTSTDASNNTSTVDVLVNVLDVSAPVITRVGVDPVSVAQGTAYTDAGATGSDNVDGDISANIVTVNPVDTAVAGSYTVTYNLSDAAGNAATQVTRTVNVNVNVTDQTPPVITLNGAAAVTVTQGLPYSEAGATALDDVDGDISGSMEVFDPVDVNTPGVYIVTYNVSDSSGNAAVQVSRSVTVEADTDGDGVSDIAEASLGTDPLLLKESDHDRDGAFTLTELALGSDPAASQSKPGVALLGQTDSLGIALANAVATAGGANDTSPFGLNTPSGLAIDPVGHRLFVADLGNARVLVFQLDANNAIASRKAVGVLGHLDLEHNAINDEFGTAASAFGLDSPESLSYFDDGTTQWLLVADPADHRVLIYDVSAGVTGVTPAKVLGQSSFTTAGTGLSATTMNFPTDAKVLRFGTRTLLSVCDRNNDRVLFWDVSAGMNTLVDGQAADFVIGAADFVTNVVNTAFNTDASNFYNPYSIAQWGNVLFVSDEFNHRVLGFDLGANAANLADGMSATYVLGQANFTAITENRGGAVAANGLWIAGNLAVGGDFLYVSDWGNSRVLVYDLAQFTALGTAANGMDAVFVYGQPDLVTNLAVTAQNRLEGPWGIALAGNLLYVSDDVSDRILSYDVSTLASQIASLAYGPNAGDLIGQTTWVPGMTDGMEAPVWNAFGSNDTGATGMDSPRDVALGTVLGVPYLFVADQQNFRVLAFAADANGVPLDMEADFVLGQSDFHTDGFGVGQSIMDVPYGVAFDDGNSTLFVADNANNRVLMFDLSLGLSNGMAAAAVLGQPDFVSSGFALSAAGQSAPNKMTVGTVAGVRYLFVTDSGNGRVLLYDLSDGVINGEPAAHVLGQADFITQALTASLNTLTDPMGIDFDPASQRLFVADGAGNRVLVWDLSAGVSDGMPALAVLGQPDGVSAAAGLGPAQMNGASDVAFDASRGVLWVADMNNNRVLGFDASGPLTTGMNATYVLGQPDFVTGSWYSTYMTRTAYTTGAPHGLYVGPAGHLMVVQWDDSRVAVFGN